MTETIAICGGIGSGKSIVSRILTVLGFDVYDCDSEAKRLMDADEAMKDAIARDIAEECIVDGTIDRHRLAGIVFSDSVKLEALNAIVHAAVRRHLAAWIEARTGRPKFIETAILYQSGLDRMVDEVWEVTAPADVRIARVMARNSMSAAEVKARIDAQDAFVPVDIHPSVHVISNDNITPVLPQIEMLLRQLCGQNNPYIFAK